MEKSSTLLKVFVLTVLLFVFRQPLTVDIHYYYILELSFYLSLLFSQITDIRRKVRMIHTTQHASRMDRRASVRTTVRQQRFRVDTRKSCSAYATTSRVATQKMTLSLPDCPSLFLPSPQLRYVLSVFSQTFAFNLSVSSLICGTKIKRSGLRGWTLSHLSFSSHPQPQQWCTTVCFQVTSSKLCTLNLLYVPLIIIIKALFILHISKSYKVPKTSDAFPWIFPFVVTFNFTFAAKEKYSDHQKNVDYWIR